MSASRRFDRSNWHRPSDVSRDRSSFVSRTLRRRVLWHGSGGRTRSCCYGATPSGGAGSGVSRYSARRRGRCSGGTTAAMSASMMPGRSPDRAAAAGTPEGASGRRDDRRRHRRPRFSLLAAYFRLSPSSTATSTQSPSWAPLRLLFRHAEIISSSRCSPSGKPLRSHLPGLRYGCFCAIRGCSFCRLHGLLDQVAGQVPGQRFLPNTFIS